MRSNIKRGIVDICMPEPPVPPEPPEPPHTISTRLLFYTTCTLKDAMPVSLGQNCLHLTFLPYLSSETNSRKYEKLPYIVIYACKSITKNIEFVENVWPANSALFIYVSTHGV